MIKAQELRIGNWYNFKNPMSGEFTPSQFKNWVDAFDFEAYGESIPLTPEILEKCGFKKFGTNEYQLEYRPDYWIVFDSNFECHLIYDVESYLALPHTHINSLHQLQNLYYALTGQELNYTP